MSADCIKAAAILKDVEALEVLAEADLEALAGQLLGQNRVVIPAPVKQLDKPHSAFGQAAGQQAVGGEGSGLFGVRAVEVEDVVGFVAEVGDFRYAGLHPVGHFALGDVKVDFRQRSLAAGIRFAYLLKSDHQGS